MSIDLSLDRLASLIPHLPHQYTRPTIHITGTNGKGSVSALVSSVLLHSTPPLSVGRFNSPHLTHITDCILVNDRPIDVTTYLQTRSEVEELDRTNGTHLSPFEVLTLTALQIFEKSNVDVAVVEVGMGGRLDATNVIPSECILVSALTAVDMDHQGFLGSTVSAIAKEKAGIARPSRPFVLGPQKHSQAVENTVKDVVAGIGGVLVPGVEVQKREWSEEVDGTRPLPFSLRSGVGHEFQPPPPLPVQFSFPLLSDAPIPCLLPLHGDHQLDNLSTALGIVDALLKYPPPTSHPRPSGVVDFQSRITLQSLRQGIQDVQWRGRLSWHTINLPFPRHHHTDSVTVGGPSPSLRTLHVLVDGAHNPASSKTLGDYITNTIFPALAPSAPSRSQAQPGAKPPQRLYLTYILALSHSPPKSPRKTLRPLLSLPLPLPPTVSVSVSVALVPFTQPAHMPWVRPVPPSELEAVVKELVPHVEEVWVPHLSEEAASATPSSSPCSSAATVEAGFNPYLKHALEWAGAKSSGNDVEQNHLVVLAGSLYLVADFYRLLEREGRVDIDASS